MDIQQREPGRKRISSNSMQSFIRTAFWIRNILTDTWDTMEQKFYEGKTGIIAGTLSSTQIYDNKMRSVNGEESELVILPPAKGVAQGYRAEDVTKEERGFTMNIDSKNKDAAWAVLEFMASPEGRILDKVGN